MRIETRDDVERQIAAWQAEHTGSSIALANLLCDRQAISPDRLAPRYEDAAGNDARASFTGKGYAVVR